ncbi:hypothetical protein D3C73_396750 [compost metagenome]
MELRVQLFELEHRAAKAAELLFQQFMIHWALLCNFKLHLGIHPHRGSLLNIRPEGHQRLTGVTNGPNTYREYPVWLLRLIGLTHPLIQRRITRLPDPVANMQLAQIHVITARNDVDNPAFASFSFDLHAFAAQIIDASALFLLRRVSGVEYNTVTTFHRSIQTADDAIP